MVLWILAELAFMTGDAVVVGLSITDVGLCKELLTWPAAGTGFNPYVQSGSGDERD